MFNLGHPTQLEYYLKRELIQMIDTRVQDASLKLKMFDNVHEFDNNFGYI